MSSPLDPDEVPEWLQSQWPAELLPKSIVAGINSDDCAAIQWPESILVASMDFLNARPIAMETGLGTGYDLGRLLVGANLSDLCGSGATPVALIIGVMMERGAESSDFQEIIRGIKAEADRWGIPVVGGDTKLGGSRVLVATALGMAKSREHLFLKSAARCGDLLWISGEIGSCTAAIIGLGIEPTLGAEWQQWATRAILEPQLPLQVSRCVSELNLGRGGTDISDGLGADVSNMCQASGVGAMIHVHNIPIAPRAAEVAAHLGIPSWSLAFGLGGDFQFIVTTPADSRETAERCGLFLIGEITDTNRCVLMLPNGGQRIMPIGGHRDSRNINFRDEAMNLVQQVLQER